MSKSPVVASTRTPAAGVDRRGRRFLLGHVSCAPVDDAPVSFAQEGVSLPAPAAASPRTALRYRLPLPVLPAVDLAPDWMVRGQSFAQETRCPAVGNRLMSSPISAMMTCAMCGPTPGISSRMSTRSAVEGTADLWPGVGCAMAPGPLAV